MPVGVAASCVATGPGMTGTMYGPLLRQYDAIPSGLKLACKSASGALSRFFAGAHRTVANGLPHDACAVLPVYGEIGIAMEDNDRAPDRWRNVCQNARRGTVAHRQHRADAVRRAAVRQL